MERFRPEGEKLPTLNQRLFVIQPTFDAVDIINSFPASYAVLSHYSCEHFQYLSQPYFPLLDEARHHPHMLHYPHIPLAFAGVRILFRIRFPSLPPAFAVLNILLKLASFGMVVCDAPLRGT